MHQLLHQFPYLAGNNFKLMHLELKVVRFYGIEIKYVCPMEDRLGFLYQLSPLVSTEMNLLGAALRASHPKG